jgi:hypothetical protein
LDEKQVKFGSFGSRTNDRLKRTRSKLAARGIAMTETKPKRRWFSFSIRELLLFTAILALAVAWWIDHRRLTTLSDVPTQLIDNAVSKDRHVTSLKRSIDILKAKVVYPDAKEQLTPAEIQERIRLLERVCKLRFEPC